MIFGEIHPINFPNPRKRCEISVMTHVKPRSNNFIVRLNQSLETWLKTYLPLWLYKQVTFQPDRALGPNNNKVAIAYSLLFIVMAIILLIISLQ